MKAPLGAVVGIYYDGKPAPAGTVLRTRTGRLYLVVHRRVQARGRSIGRQHLRCLVVAEPTPGAQVLPLLWYSRG